MLNYSDEQMKIINAVNDNHNIIIDAVAGSGKTTTIIGIAENHRNKQILQITYNRRLKEEVRQRIAELYLDNVEIHSYHSLGVKYYTRLCYRDIGIVKSLQSNLPILSQPNIDYMIIDECQDMTNTLFLFICKFYRDLDNKPKLIFMGDKYQCIYRFKQANAYFLTMSNYLWYYPYNNIPISEFVKNNQLEFKQCELSTSYRVTKQIATFVNISMIGKRRIISNRDGPNVKILYSENDKETYNNAEFIAAYINTKINIERTHNANDFMIILPSVKYNRNRVHDTPWQRIENLLANNGHRIFISSKIDEQIDGEETDRKILITTIHQSKGLGRKIVFVFNFDNSYFTYYARGYKRSICPNTLYVAATRASEELFLLTNGEFPDFLYLPHKVVYTQYVNILKAQRTNESSSYSINTSTDGTHKYKLIQSHNNMADLFTERHMREIINNNENNDIRHYNKKSVTDLVSFMNIHTEQILNEEVKRVLDKQNNIPLNVVNVRNSLRFSYGNENVSDLNSYVCTYYYFIKENKNSLLFGNFYWYYSVDINSELSLDEGDEFFCSFLRYEQRINIPDELKISVLFKIVNESNYENITAQQLIKICAMDRLFNSKLLSPYIQIGTEFNWLSMRTIEQASENLKSVIGSIKTKNIVIEHLVGVSVESLRNFISNRYQMRYGHEINDRSMRLLINEYNKNHNIKVDNQPFFVHGYSDYIDCDTRTMYEFKFKTEITLEDKLQLILYAFLYEHYYNRSRNVLFSFADNNGINQDNYPKTFYLFNIKTCELYKLKPIDDEVYNILKDMYIYILRTKIVGDEDIEFDELLRILISEEKNYPFTTNDNSPNESNETYDYDDEEDNITINEFPNIIEYNEEIGFDDDLLNNITEIRISNPDVPNDIIDNTVKEIFV